MSQKCLIRAIPILLTAAMLVLAETSCYAGGVQTGAKPSSGSGYSPAPSYSYAAPATSFSTFGYYYAPSVAPARSDQAVAEEQEEPVKQSAPAKLEVRVPANAELWVEGGKTSQNGAMRSFISPELQPGKAFTYTIRAHWVSPTGQLVDETRQVKVQAGRQTMVDFLKP